ncbi:MAG TPA: carotenoid biosynthesis protein [Roseiflexaceae bacterium]|nr:carotenoid biosynthesis protein [Roseiflexaceae bacterium]
MRHTTTPVLSFARWIALGLFLVYVAVFPGSTLLVALDRVPAWGVWFGGALLFLQGGAVLFWLIAEHGRRGALAGLLIGALAFAVEYLGATTGFPFGSYHYTTVLQPQILGTVPLAICAAWLMVVPAAWEIARRLLPGRLAPALLATASLVLLLDLQIETVAALINGYWIWDGSGPYYGVPTANFVAWWVVGLLMGALLVGLTGAGRQAPQPAPDAALAGQSLPGLALFLIARSIPILIYLLSTAMFVAINLARGYLVAGLVGALVLAAAAALIARGEIGVETRGVLRRRSD